MVGAGTNFLLRPGTLAYLGVDQMVLNRLPWPWTSECVDQWPSSVVPYVYDSVAYNSLMCSVTCRNAYLIDTCGCAITSEIGNKDSVICSRGKMGSS